MSAGVCVDFHTFISIPWTFQFLPKTAAKQSALKQWHIFLVTVEDFMSYVNTLEHCLGPSNHRCKDFYFINGLISLYSNTEGSRRNLFRNVNLFRRVTDRQTDRQTLISHRFPSWSSIHGIWPGKPSEGQGGPALILWQKSYNPLMLSPIMRGIQWILSLTTQK